MHSRSSNPLKRKYQLKLFQYYENQVARRADYCFTPHYPLCDKLLKVNQCVEMLFHAHNCNVVPHGLSYNKSRHIKVAYAGYLHYRLIDSWLKMALDDSDIDLYLIGPLHPNYNIEQFRKYPNFHLISALGEDKLLTKLTEMDVLVIPYHPHLPEVEVLTTTSKLFQYVVTEKPIVISTLPNFIEMPKGIYYKAKDKKDFIYQIKKAFDDDCPEYIQLRKKIAQENHWNKRGDQLHEIIQQALLTA
jgi:hypothetical protein